MGAFRLFKERVGLKSKKPTSYSADIFILNDEVQTWLTKGRAAKEPVKTFNAYLVEGGKDPDRVPNLDQAYTFLADANDIHRDYTTRIDELQRDVTIDSEKRDLQKVRDDLGKAMLGDLLPLMAAKRSRFRSVVDLKMQAKNIANSGTMAAVHETLRQEADRDSQISRRTVEAQRPARPEPEKFSMQSISAGMTSALPNRDSYQDTDEDVVAIKNSARDEVARLLQGKGENSDLAFDLALKTKKNILDEYCNSRWGFIPGNPDLKAIADAVAAGMFEAAQASGPVQLDKTSGTVKLGTKHPSNFANNITCKGQTYSNPEFLGDGSYGTVVKYTSDAGQTVVLKAVDNSDPDSLREEAWSNRNLSQGAEDAPGRENLLLMNGVVHGDDDTTYVVMDLADGGDLQDTKYAMNAVRETGALPEEAHNVLNQYMMKQAIEGIKYLRDQNMVHYDLKELNAMIMGDGTVKVIDFGMAKTGEEGQRVSSGGGSGGYGEPNIMHGQVDFSTKSDTWALGRMLETLHMGDNAPEMNPIQSLTGALKNIHKPMATKDYQERPVLEAVLDSSYFGNLDNYDPQTVKELMAATVSYSKALKGKKVDGRGIDELTYVRQDSRQKLAKIEQKMKPTTDLGREIETLQEEIKPFKQEVEELKKEIKPLREEIETLESKEPKQVEVINRKKKMLVFLEQQLQERQSQLADKKRPLDEKLKPWNDLRAEIQKAESDMRKLSEDPAVKPHVDKIRELSGALQRPSELVVPVTKTSTKEFADQLVATANSPEAFSAFVGQSQFVKLWEASGIKQADAHRLAEHLKTTQVKQSAADDEIEDTKRLDKAHRDVNALLKTASNPEITFYLRAAFNELLGQLHLAYLGAYNEPYTPPR